MVYTRGLFIPLDNHIDIYCESSDYGRCPEYTDSDSIQETVTANKRKRIRIDSKHPVTIVHLDETGRVVSREISKATTIDLSMSGMRLMTSEPLQENSLIQFSLDNCLLDELHHGIAVSKWCSPSREKAGYQVGLAFHNEETARAMGNYFNLAIRRKKIWA